MSEETNQQNPRRDRGEGSIFRKGNAKTWVIQYYKRDLATGRAERVREYTGLRSKQKAQKRLNERLVQAERGEIIETRGTTARIEDLIPLVRQTVSSKDSSRGLYSLNLRWKHLEPIFGKMPVVKFTTKAAADYTQKRLQQDNAAPATVNRELAVLRRAFRLGQRCIPPMVRAVPYIQMLKENNVRRGFLEESDFQRLIAQPMETWLRTIVEVAYTYGWRRGELLDLRVRNINFCHGTIRLDPGTTKNGEGREVVMTARVRELLCAAVADKGPDDHVLTRKDGEPVREFRDAWSNLCIRAGVGKWQCRSCKRELKKEKNCPCGGRREFSMIFHNTRRSAGKNLRRAGVAESVIMQTGGWKTNSMFRRYAIVDNRDQRDAMTMLEAMRVQEREELERDPKVGSPSAPLAVRM